MFWILWHKSDYRLGLKLRMFKFQEISDKKIMTEYHPAGENIKLTFWRNVIYQIDKCVSIYSETLLASFYSLVKWG